MKDWKKTFWYSLYFINWAIIISFWFFLNKTLFQGGISSTLFAVGSLFGLAAANLILNQVFFISRFPPLEQTFGLDRLTRFHSISGKWGIILILLHPFLIVLGGSVAFNASFVTTLLNFLKSSEDLLNAFLALCLFVVVVVFSLAIIREKLKYENWYYVHLLVYLAIFFSFEHQFELGASLTSSRIFYGYFVFLYIFVLGTHLLFRFLRPIYLSLYHDFRISDIRRESADVVSLYISGKKLDRFKVLPGQFMILRFLSKVTKWQAHPFSVSKMPDGKMFRVSIKALGDFTSKVPELPLGTKVVIDGPHGIFTDSEMIRNKVLLIAGGIGITPIRALAEGMAKSGRKVVLLYGNKTKEDIVFKEELEDLEAQYGVRTVHVLSANVEPEMESGYIDEEKIRKYAPDVHERDVYICGPVAMTDSIISMLRGIGISKDKIHYEKFSFT